MCEKYLGHCVVLKAFHRSPRHAYDVTFCFPSLNFFCDGICIGNSMICSDVWHKYHE